MKVKEINNYNFKLTPGYCLYNGIVVVSQQGASICFLTENLEDELLKTRIKKAFFNYLAYVLKRPDCPLEFKHKPYVEFVKGNRNEIRKYVSHLYAKTETLSKKLFPNEEASLANKNSGNNESAAVLLLDTLIQEARQKNATDIHIEKNTVKFRIYGTLEAVEKLSEEKSRELVQRIKFLAGMNVLENRRSQDGHFVYGKENPLFIRVSSIGIVSKDGDENAESIVIRLLDTKRLPLTLKRLGFSEIQQVHVKKMMGNKNGLIVICGPTGAGKSTTAAALLMELEKINENKIKIISLEDPPEYLLPGVTQIQINEKISNSFSETLMHIFRQDPDVLMIGEIRDEVSAAVAIRAALTGHLVIATLHTTSPAAAVLRLENLGIPIKLIVSVLKGVIVQELNNFKGSINLMADVAFPNARLEDAVKEVCSEEELDKCFEHNNNYAELLQKTLNVLKRKHTAIMKEEEEAKKEDLKEVDLFSNSLKLKHRAG